MPRLIRSVTLACLLGGLVGPLAAEEGGSPLTLDLGGGASVTLYGYVKADFIRNMGFDLGNTTSGIKNIGLPGGPATGDFDQTTLRETRIGFDVKAPELSARFEGDFYGSGGYFRLRHAWVEWHGLMVGQNWTNFMSVENLADTVDFQGAGALPFARVPQVRYTFQATPDLTLSASVEEDVGNSDDLAYTVAARYGFDNGMVRLSGLWRDATLAGTPVKGWAANLGTVLHLWQGGTIKADIATGDGSVDILGNGLSGTAVFQGGSTVGYTAGAITLSQQATDKLKLAITGSWTDLDRAVGTDTKSLRTLHLSGFYTVARNTTLMAEYFTGTRTNGAGAGFDVDRVQLAVKYSF
jgi:hypothetical protein